MYGRSDALVRAFKSFHSGQDEALQQIFASESSRVYDYVMRMTAHVSKAADTVREALESLEPVADSAETLDELVLMMYKTARNFAIDSWNVDTSKLENSNYDNGPNATRDMQTLVALEHVVRTLVPQQREVLLLIERFWFTPDEVAEIMGISASDAEILLAQAHATIEQSLGMIRGNLHEMINKLHPFAEPEDETMATQNLSLIMNDFKKTDKLGRSRAKWVWFGIIVVLVLAGYVYKEQIATLFKLQMPANQNSSEMPKDD